MSTTTASTPRTIAQGRRRPTRAQTWSAVGAAIVVALVHLAPAAGLTAGALDGDLGIQYHLGGETARGALPLVDFEHTWNTLSWYFNGLLHLVAAGDPSVWLYLWGRVFGPALAAVLAVVVLYRLRLSHEWILVGAGSWLALSHVVHSKYTIPILWVLVLLPTGRHSSLRRAVVVRMVLAGTTALAHIELAVLLGAGVMLFDLIGSDVWGDHVDESPDLRRRLLRAAALPAGVVVFIAAELALYAAFGHAPGEIIRQLLSNPTQTAPGFTYGYPLFSAPSLRPKVFPASLLIAFVPVIWNRLGQGTRLVACLHLAQALIAIRRPDPSHVDAATTLLGLLIVLVVHDLVVTGRAHGPISRPGFLDLWPTALGAVAVVAAVFTGFRVESLFALAMPVALATGLVLVSQRWRSSQRGLSWGAGVVLAGLLVGSVAGGVVTSLRDGDALALTAGLAQELDGPLDRCTDGTRVAWVVPGPLTLYEEMSIHNPTPFTVFWYGFAAEHARVRTMIDAGAIPAIVQVGDSWPASFGTLAAAVQSEMSLCAELPTTTIGGPVRIWRTG